VPIPLALAALLTEGLAVGLHRLLVACWWGIVAVLGSGLRTVLAVAVRTVVVAPPAAPPPAPPALASSVAIFLATHALALAANLALAAGIGLTLGVALGFFGARRIALDFVVAGARQLLRRAVIA